MTLYIVGDIMKKFILLIIVVVLVFLLAPVIFNNTISSKKVQNEFEKSKCYRKENLTRYQNYQKKEPDLKIKEIVLRVNMNLDRDFYTNTKVVKNPSRIDVLINKYYHFPDGYEPDDLVVLPSEYARGGMKLRKEAKEALDKLVESAKKDNMDIYVQSSYRSYDYQVKLYNNYQAKDGKEAADKYSARPGYSEHQTGLSIDIGTKKVSFNNFENTEEYNWMQANAYRYGFILRFPKNKEAITGYIYESWHYRYVGKKIAKRIHDNKLSLEEYIACN